MRRLLIWWGFLFGLLGGMPTLHAQSLIRRPSLYEVVYRPPGVRYRVDTYPHFDLIYQQGTVDTAHRMGTILERNLAATDSLVGRAGEGLHMPVVLNGYNDRSNGLVSPLSFRQEIEAPSIKNDVVTTYFPSWPAAVAPHELVHATHAEINAGVGVGGLVHLFAPDWSRVINLTAPSGLVEGIAVYRESQLHPRAGRLRTPLATMKYRAAMASEEPWSLAQMLEAPAYTRPFDRHYLGGGQAVQYLAERENPSSTAFFKRATRLHNRLPFLGFGIALWHGTGETPGQLNDEMQDTLRAREQARLDALGPFTELTTVDGAPGLVYRRPRWLDSETLVAYVQGYDVRPGFYRIDAKTGTRTRIRATTITEDFTYSFNADTTALYYGRYVTDPFVPTQHIAEVERLTLSTGESEQLTRHGRALAPVEAPDGTLWALRNDGPFNHWARVAEVGTVISLPDRARTRFRQIAPAPDGSTIAVLLNIDGTQSIYKASVENGRAPQLAQWIGFDEGAIYDVCWGPSGRYLLFSADPTGVANVYAYDTDRRRLLRMTNVPFGALEPTLSPDGSTLAFVNYQHEQFDLVRIPFVPAQAKRIDREVAVRNGMVSKLEGGQRSVHSTPAGQAPSEAKPYQAWRYLAPRMLYPTPHYEIDEPSGPHDTTLGLGVGLVARGADPLQQWTYQAEAFCQAHRMWGEFSVQTGRFLLRPSLSVYDRPFTVGGVPVIDEGGMRVGTAQAALEERGVALGLQTPVTFTSNVFLTQARFRLDGELRQTRFIDEEGTGQTAFRDRVTLNPALAFGYRLQANPRDLWPNTGGVISTTAEVDAWTDGVPAGRALVSNLRVYLPFLMTSNTGLRLGAGLLTQNRGSIFNLDTFVPRGYEDRVLGAGTFLRLDAEYLHPLWHIDDGSVLLPLYFKALYTYGFAQTLQPVGATVPQRLSSVGVGLGLQFRFFYQLDLDVRLGGAYRIEPGDVEGVFR